MTGVVREHRKVQQILKGARAVFTELGYEGATVDEIARRAGVSKPTLYTNLGDKRAIFEAVLRQEFEAQARAIFPETSAAVSAEAGLRSIAVHYIGFLLSESAQELFRITVAESHKFPELGRAFYASGPGLGVTRLATFLEAAVARGELAIGNVELAAHQFTELCRADVFYRRLFCGEAISAAEVQTVADAAVRLFLAGHSAPARV